MGRSAERIDELGRRSGSLMNNSKIGNIRTLDGENSGSLHTLKPVKPQQLGRGSPSPSPRDPSKLERSNSMNGRNSMNQFDPLKAQELVAHTLASADGGERSRDNLISTS